MVIVCTEWNIPTVTDSCVIRAVRRWSRAGELEGPWLMGGSDGVEV